jgi:hypothetical protein
VEIDGDPDPPGPLSRRPLTVNEYTFPLLRPATTCGDATLRTTRASGSVVQLSVLIDGAWATKIQYSMPLCMSQLTTALLSPAVTWTFVGASGLLPPALKPLPHAATTSAPNASSDHAINLFIFQSLEN